MNDGKMPLNGRAETNEEPIEGAQKPKSGVHNWMPAELKAWLDGELSAPRVLMVRAHLLVCAACREEVTWLKRLGEDMRDLERAVPSPLLRSRILAALPEAPPGRTAPVREPSRQWSRQVPVFATAAAAACGALIFAITISRPARSADPRGEHGIVRVENGTQAKPGDSGSGPVTADAAAHKPDPYSAEADRLFEQFLRDEENKSSRLIAQNRSNWNGFVAALRDERKLVHSGGTLTLAMAVPDVNEAEAALNSWAKSASAGAAPLDAGQQGASLAPIVTTSEQQGSPGFGAQTFQGRIVALRVPAARIASLEPVLRRLGAWGSSNRKKPSEILKVAEAPKISAGVARPGAPLANRPDDPARQPAATTPSTTIRTGASDQAVGRDGAPAFLTLRFELSSLGVTAP